jgi:hypothetical protein
VAGPHVVELVGLRRTAAKGIKFTYATATWVVPSVKKITGYSSAWVGVDGFSNNNLIQTGTESDFVNGKAVYRAWWRSCRRRRP